MSSGYIRTFIAVEINNDEVLRRLSMVRDALLESGADLKPVATENMHITLRFIGEIPPATVQRLCSSLEQDMRFNAFKVNISGLGVFPNIRRPRVIWAGVTDGMDELIQLHSSVEKTVSRLGLPREKEKYIPHVTLARVKSGRNIARLVKIIEQYIDTVFGVIIVDHISVKRSILTPKGPIYSTICEIKAVEE